MEKKLESGKINIRNLESGFYFLKAEGFETTKFKKE